MFSDFEAGENGDDSSGGGNSWREELQLRYQQENDFLAELHARNNMQMQNNHAEDPERGEREEADGQKEDETEAQWAEAFNRMVNR